MARQVVNITKRPSDYDILSQTPKNYNENNYFLKELQDKVNAEWRYRPNRVDIEYEDNWGEQTYAPIEVVVQTIKSEKGTDISNDYKTIVFRNIFEDRFVIGSRFRFSERYHLEDTVDQKNVWLSINTNSAQLTASMAIQRCNGSLISAYKNEQGLTYFHEEPVIQADTLSGVNLLYSETAISPQNQLIIVAQHNKYTAQWFVNQRFIVGYDAVYRVKAINKFYANSTFQPHNVGLIKVYLEVTESSPYDNFEARIAYQMTPEVVLKQGDNLVGHDPAQYMIGFTQPEVIPSRLEDTSIIFEPVLYKNSIDTIIDNVNIQLECKLQNLPSSVDMTNYFSVEKDNNTYKFTRQRLYLRGNLELRWFIAAEESPTHEELSATMELSLK